MEQQLGAVHQALHQRLCFGQRDAGPEVHGVYLLKELLPVGCTYKLVLHKLHHVMPFATRAGLFFFNHLPQSEDDILQITKIERDLLQGAEQFQLLDFVLEQEKKMESLVNSQVVMV